MLNAERSPTFYRFDSLEQLRVWREMDDRDEEPVVIYHSHTATEAYPSRTDISYASEPGAHYVLVSTRDADADEFRSFRIMDGVVTEEDVGRRRRNDPGCTPEIRPRLGPQRSPAIPTRSGAELMAIEVRIPTILRTYTSGAKAVEGSGGTLDELISDLNKHVRRPAGAAGRRRRACAAS